MEVALRASDMAGLGPGVEAQAEVTGLESA